MSESFSPSYSVNKKHKMEADIMNEEQISQTLLDQMVSSDRGQMIKPPFLIFRQKDSRFSQSMKKRLNLSIRFLFSAKEVPAAICVP